MGMQPLPRNGSFPTHVDQRQGSPCLQDAGSDSQATVPYLPEDIWSYIHSLMEMPDAARAACLSRAFLRSWRCRPNLTLDWKTLCSKGWGRYLSTIIDSTLRNHSGIGLKILNLHLYKRDSTFPYIDSWLQVAVTPGIEELALVLYKKYNFPCSLLSDGVRNSIQSLELDTCTFRPTAELGPLRRLTSLHLSCVRITGDELECLLSNSLNLEKLDLFDCNEIIFLKIPCVLQQLNCLTVVSCWRLQVIENKAPNLSSLEFGGNVIGETLQIKNLSTGHSEGICYARAELPSIMPNLETLGIRSDDEVSQEGMEHESVRLRDSSHLRQLSEHCRYDRLKSVEIIPFSSAKSLVELTRCIVKSAVSLEHLTLDTLRVNYRCSELDSSNSGDIFCWPLGKAVLDGASRAATAIRMYIEGVVPPTAELTVLGPCTRCHSIPVDGYEPFKVLQMLRDHERCQKLS